LIFCGFTALEHGLSFDGYRRDETGVTGGGANLITNISIPLPPADEVIIAIVWR